MILKIARALAPSDARLREDLAQEGFLGLILASSSYDPERGPFEAFARRCARNRMISYLRKQKPSHFLTDEEMENLAVETSPEEKIDLHRARTSLFSRLSPFEMICLDAYLYAGSSAGAAELLGWEPKKVENALTRIRIKARRIRENPFLGNEAGSSGQEPGVSLQ
jgi:RNA polymerase sporulation-specific sigma factor